MPINYLYLSDLKIYSAINFFSLKILKIWSRFPILLSFTTKYLYGFKLFDGYKIRTKWDSEIEDYYYSVIDVIAVLNESKNPRNYWRVLKKEIK